MSNSPHNLMPSCQQIQGEIPPSAENDILKLKDLGNRAFLEHNFLRALMFYDTALNSKQPRPPLDHSARSILLANRSAALSSLGNFAQARDDASESVRLQSQYPKGYLRGGQACEGQMIKRIDAYSSVSFLY